MRIELSPPAGSDIDAAFDWYASRSPDAVEAFLEALDHALAMVSLHPDVWPAYESGTRRSVFPGFPFSVVCLIASDGILVVAVSAHRRRPGYWR